MDDFEFMLHKPLYNM